MGAGAMAKVAALVLIGLAAIQLIEYENSMVSLSVIQLCLFVSPRVSKLSFSAAPVQHRHPPRTPTQRRHNNRVLLLLIPSQIPSRNKNIHPTGRISKVPKPRPRERRVQVDATPVRRPRRAGISQNDHRGLSVGG